VGGVYDYVAAALEYDHRAEDRMKQGDTMTINRISGTA
jgi:hypothetical protein